MTIDEWIKEVALFVRSAHRRIGQATLLNALEIIQIQSEALEKIANLPDYEGFHPRAGIATTAQEQVEKVING